MSRTSQAALIALIALSGCTTSANGGGDGDAGPATNTRSDAVDDASATPPPSDARAAPVPAGWDARDPATALDAADCAALCTWVASDPVGDGAEGDACTRVCPQVCEGLVGLGQAGCRLETADVASCALALRAPDCEVSQGLAAHVSGAAGCAAAASCVQPAQGTPLDEMSPEDQRAGCAAAVAAARDAADSCRPDWLDSIGACLEWIAGWACERGWGDAPPTGAAVPDAGVLLGCARAAADAACDLPTLCAEVEPAPAGDSALIALSCRQARALCVPAFPDAPIGAEYPGCGPEGWIAPYYEPAEACVRAVGRLRSACATTPDDPRCSAPVTAIATCAETEVVDGCPVIGSGGCLAPTAEESAPALPDVAIADATTDALRGWCEWRLGYGGGAGYLPLTCSHNIGAATMPSVDACVADLRRAFGPCPDVSLNDVHSCVAGMWPGDACHQVGSFTRCSDDKEWDACHLIQAGDGCSAVDTCLREVWDVVDAPSHRQ